MHITDIPMRVGVWLLPVVVRWFYSIERMQRKILIQLASAGEGLTVHPHAESSQLWLDVTNHLPIAITVDRITAHYNIEGAVGELTRLMPVRVRENSTEHINLTGLIMDRSGQQLLKIRDRKVDELNIHVSLNVYVNSRVHCFAMNAHISGVRNVRII